MGVAATRANGSTQTNSCMPQARPSASCCCQSMRMQPYCSSTARACGQRRVQPQQRTHARHAAHTRQSLKTLHNTTVVHDRALGAAQTDSTGDDTTRGPSQHISLTGKHAAACAHADARRPHSLRYGITESHADVTHTRQPATQHTTPHSSVHATSPCSAAARAAALAGHCRCCSCCYCSAASTAVVPPPMRDARLSLLAQQRPAAGARWNRCVDTHAAAHTAHAQPAPAGAARCVRARMHACAPLAPGPVATRAAAAGAR